MTETSASVSTFEQLETAILADVVTRFANLRERTSRHLLLIKFEGQPAGQAITNLVGRSLIRNQGVRPTDEEEYLPTAAGFEFCGNQELRERAKSATTVVLRTLKQMFKGERKKQGLTLEDLERHVEDLEPNTLIESATLKLGLYLAKDSFNVISASTSPDGIEVTSFRIGEAAISMANPDSEWDRVMAGFRPILGRAGGSGKSFSVEPPQEWEQIGPLGSGGQSDVFLVRSPDRASERAICLQKIRTSLDGDKRADLAEAIWSYVRPESPSEIGALKVFKIPPEGQTLTSKENEAIERLKNEITVLSQSRRGLPKLFDSNLKKRWIVSEYFPERTLEHHPSRYKGKAVTALKAFRSLVETVASLHKDGYVHRDIKPPNVFIRSDDELALGDFGIVYVPDATERVTRTGERVGPRDYMPQWANLGMRHDEVDACFDVYMLGKLLWSMVDGRMFLPREYHNRPEHPEFDLTKTFPGDPDMFLINRILDKCVVEDSSKCLSSAQDLLLMVDAIVSALGQGGQLLSPGVPRPCHVCGTGSYQPQSLQPNKTVGTIRLWTGGSDTASMTVETFACNSCGHIEFFKTAPQ